MTLRSILTGAAALGALSSAVVPAAVMAQPYNDPNGYYDQSGRYQAYDQNGYAYDACKRDTNKRGVTGGLLGAALGATVGSNVAARGHRSDGALLGGVVGAVAGAKVGSNSAACRDDRPYDEGYQGQGYYQGQPYQGQGYYDQGQGYQGQGYSQGYYDQGYQDAPPPPPPPPRDAYYDNRYQGGGYQGGSYYDPCHRDTTQRGVTGALVGGGLGAVVGSNIAAGGHRSDGALVGAAVGALAGAKVGRDSAACRSQSGYYDNRGGGYYGQGSGYQGSSNADYAYDRYGHSYAITNREPDANGCTVAESPVYMPDGRVEQRYVNVCPDANGRYQVVD